ncbi:MULTISPECIES: hypothetical protein [unclassified Streptomyces]|nr:MULTISPECIES: hypothetical protein [unclassified Streptomyces]WSC38627.1 hypothetical protein OHA08_25730 [Streptomyces sp. NBC_01763]
MRQLRAAAHRVTVVASLLHGRLPEECPDPGFIWLFQDELFHPFGDA